MAERAVSFHPSKKGDVSVNAHTRGSSLPLLCWASERSATTLRVGDRGVKSMYLRAGSNGSHGVLGAPWGAYSKATPPARKPDCET